eukprot:9573538-Ditylum_brightwellii.AAC.1
MGMSGLYFLWCLLALLVMTGLDGAALSCSFLITATTRGRGKFVVLCIDDGITMDKNFDGRRSLCGVISPWQKQPNTQREMSDKWFLLLQLCNVANVIFVAGFCGDS